MKTVCQSCGRPREGSSGSCAECGGVALVDTVWSPDEFAVTIKTPLMRSRTPGLEDTLLKVEGANLGGSFKDRVMNVLVRDAKERHVPGAIVASSGNAAVSAAAACARADLPLLVLVAGAASDSPVRLSQLHGATVVRCGEGPADVHVMAVRLAAEFGLANLASTFAAAGCEWACRGIGHEIAGQTSEPITHLAASISVGPVLIGACNGLVEADRPVPALLAAQAAGCAPIARAFASGRETVSPWTGELATQAVAIADRLTGYPEQATYTLARVRNSGGLVDAATDDEMRSIRLDLARYDGLDVELASCAAAVVCRRHQATGDGAVLILTGAGIKETLSSSRPGPVPRTVAEFAETVGSGPRLLKELQRWVHEFPS